jgi:3-oxoacyl-[acyl-carrier protein] reductase
MIKDLLKDQVALVTGGTAGIGKAIALTFAEHGAKVVIFGTNQERGQQVVQEISERAQGSQALFLPVNVANTQQVEEAIKKVLDSFTRVDILVNNAGITRDQLLMKMSEEDWDTVMENNVKSCYNTLHALVRSMMKARKGKIINMSSVVGLSGNPGQVNYAASKAAIIGLTKALAKELASRNICVNCVAPGFIETPMTDKLTKEQKEDTLARIPLGKMGLPQDIAYIALFLASHWSDYITGQVIAVDGGMVM